MAMPTAEPICWKGCSARSPNRRHAGEHGLEHRRNADAEVETAQRQRQDQVPVVDGIGHVGDDEAQDLRVGLRRWQHHESREDRGEADRDVD
jgi:hypothetical protein